MLVERDPIPRLFVCINALPSMCIKKCWLVQTSIYVLPSLCMKRFWLVQTFIYALPSMYMKRCWLVHTTFSNFLSLNLHISGRERVLWFNLFLQKISIALSRVRFVNRVSRSIESIFPTILLTPSSARILSPDLIWIHATNCGTTFF